MVEATTLAAFISTTAISLAPNVLLFLFPNYKPSNSVINPLAIGQALAAGGLLGDVFLHTLPHTLTPDNGEVIGLAILAGFVVFLLFDILVRSSHSHDCHDNSHSHELENAETKKKFVFTSAVVLNLAADALHNFTDGIAIGASFAGTHHDTSLSLGIQIQNLLKSQGGLASLAVLFHEIPHELGDYSILVSAGMTKHQAILAQFSTAIAAYCGTFVGLFGMQTMKDYLGNDLMVPFTAGGFIYLAAVTILPGLLEERVGKRARVVQVMAFLAGIGFMYGVALLEHAGGGCGHGHSHASHGHGVEIMHHDGHDHNHSHMLHNDHHSHNHMHKNEVPKHVEDHHREEENKHYSNNHMHENEEASHVHDHHNDEKVHQSGHTHHDHKNEGHHHNHRDDKKRHNNHNSGHHHEEHRHDEF